MVLVGSIRRVSGLWACRFKAEAGYPSAMRKMPTV